MSSRMAARISARIRVVFMAMLIALAVKLVADPASSDSGAPAASVGGARIALDLPSR